MLKKYQIFVSSTYNDLIDERRMAINAIINQRQIPAGMEFFGAMGEKQWDYIKKEIDTSDYYMLIVGGRYGSVNESGISYTEAEFDYACSKGIRVIAFLVKDVDCVPVGKAEKSKRQRDKLVRFRSKIEKQAGLIAYWTDRRDLELKIGTSLANVLREYPADTGWVRISEETQTGEEYLCSSDNGEIQKELFPELRELRLEPPQINYDVNDPSKAVVVCGSSYVRIETRDGKIEPYMLETCQEFLKFVKARNDDYLGEKEIFCLRSMWFNSVSPEVIIYIDYLYEKNTAASYSLSEIKEMFYDEEVLSDGICYRTMVRFFPVNMDSDHFYLNNKEFYETMDPSTYIKLFWEDAEFLYKDSEPVTFVDIKIVNSSRYSLKFSVEAEFEVFTEKELWPGLHTISFVRAQNEAGNEIFALGGRESKVFRLYFRQQKGERPLKARPYNMYPSVNDGFPQYK